MRAPDIFRISDSTLFYGIDTPHLKYEEYLARTYDESPGLTIVGRLGTLRTVTELASATLSESEFLRYVDHSLATIRQAPRRD